MVRLKNSNNCFQNDKKHIILKTILNDKPNMLYLFLIHNENVVIVLVYTGFRWSML